MKKIMFIDFLTRSVLVGEKTNTRRIIPKKLFQECCSNGLIEAGGFNSQWEVKTKELLLAKSPYKIGEEVAVAQSYKDVQFALPVPISDISFEQKQAYHIYGDTPGWHNKMFVRADLMPHRIRITNVRIERLQDISDEDCLKEGIVEELFGTTPAYWVLDVCFSNIRHAFRNLIDKTCGPNTWESNPWVFVYDFELVK